MENLRNKKAFICDMDGVIYHGNRLLPGVKAFVEWLKTNGKQFLFLTNASERSLPELQQKLQRLGVSVDANPLKSWKKRSTWLWVGPNLLGPIQI